MESYHQPIIRLAQVSDANKLKDLNDLFNDVDDTTLNDLETSLRENKDEIIICADIGTAIVGICCIPIIKTMCFNWQYGFITEIFVQEEYRNCGIGASLMKFAEKEIAKRGLKKTLLWTRKSNLRAQNLCMSFGYSELTDEIMFIKERTE